MCEGMKESPMRSENTNFRGQRLEEDSEVFGTGKEVGKKSRGFVVVLLFAGKSAERLCRVRCVQSHEVPC